jgi:hypothetical protein
MIGINWINRSVINLKNNINLGHVLISLSINALTITLIIFLSRTNYYIDSLTAEYFDNPLQYIPKGVYALIGAVIILTIYMLMHDRIKNKNS